MLTLYNPKVSQLTGCFNKKKGVVQDRPASLQLQNFAAVELMLKTAAAAVFNATRTAAKLNPAFK